MSESNKAINQTAAFDPRSEWFENADIAMVIIDPAVAAIVSVNAAAARLFDQSGAFDAIPLDPILSIPRGFARVALSGFGSRRFRIARSSCALSRRAPRTGVPWRRRLEWKAMPFRDRP